MDEEKEPLGEHTEGVLTRRGEGQGPDPVAVAREAICKLEAKMFEDFGMRVRIGTELEFAGKAKPGTAQDGNPMQLYGSNLAKRGYKPSSKRSGAMEEYLRTKPGTYEEEWATRPTGETKDRLFPDSPYVCYSYVEGTHAPPYYKYEVVLSHQGVEKRESSLPGMGPGKFRSPKHFSRAALMGDVIEQLSAIIRGSYASEAAAQNPAHAAQTALHDLFEETTFASTVRSGRSSITNGLHVNVSVAPEGGKLKDPHQLVRIQQQMQENIRSLSFENLYLFGTHDEAAERYEKRAGVKQVSSKQLYVENAVPGADANPYYGILTTLAATYNALAKDAESPHYVPVHSSARTAHEAFPHAEANWQAEENGLRKILEQVEPGLGQRFGEAIAATPPGQEARLYADPARYDIRARQGGRS